MTSGTWLDLIISERMSVDRDFQDRIRRSSFSNQQWELIMTAVEFEIQHLEDPNRARVVADTSKVPYILPEIDRMDSHMGISGSSETSHRTGTIFTRILTMLGIAGRNGNRKRLDEVDQLTREYTTELQRALEKTGKWTRVLSRAGQDATASER